MAKYTWPNLITQASINQDSNIFFHSLNHNKAALEQVVYLNLKPKVWYG